jgi:formiminoglutamase
VTAVPSSLPTDPLWPRAAHWISPADDAAPTGVVDFGLLGVGTYRTSITPTKAHATPGAIRDALMRYSTYSASHDIDVATLVASDFGDVAEPDGPDGEIRVAAAVDRVASRCHFLVALGGDNSLTYSVVRGLFGVRLEQCGLITIDAHHDLRDGISNGSPVRRLLEAGLPGTNVVQIGIADFANSAAYAARAREAGITVVPRGDVRPGSVAAVVSHALSIAGAGGRPVFVDIDVDVCDRAVVPGCPSAAPGGFSADELRLLAFELARDTRVVGADLAEIDATIDAPDGRTARLAALVVLELAAGVASRG